jgi:hypothetical protein
VDADRAQELAAEQAAVRHRRSLRGRAERLGRWLRNRQTGPRPRLRRMARVTVDGLRDPRSLPWLPAALVEAARGSRVSEARPAAVTIRSYAAEREAARRRLAGGGSGRAVDPGGLRVALIADERLGDYLEAACRPIRVRPEDWQAQLAAATPDLLLVESAWQGNGGAWQYRIAWYAHPEALLQRELRGLVAWCAARDVPTVFWDTAGLPYLRRFRDAACQFDLIVVPDGAAASAYASLSERRGAGIGLVTVPEGPEAAQEGLRAIATLAGFTVPAEVPA